MVLRALIVAALVAVPAPTQQLGRSYEGRTIAVTHISGQGKRILVVGCIHGNECEGLEVTRLLARSHPRADLWLLHQLNPDGYARRSRTNANGVDLNRDFVAATQRETRIARKLLLRVRPDVTIWFHQPQALVRAWAASRATARRYAALAGVPYRTMPWPRGSASRWQNGLGQVSFVVELGSEELSDVMARRCASAVLRLAE
jgi:protein MpaA